MTPIDKTLATTVSRRSLLGQLGTGAGLALLGAPALAAAPAVVTKKVTPFKYPDNPSFDLIYLADKLGYFEGSSTRPEYIGKVAAPQLIPLVGTGEIDFGTRMVPLVISAIASGVDIKVVAAGGKTLQEAPHMKYFVRKDSGIRKPKDLEGKTIGINSYGACSEFVTKKYLREQGVDVSRINWLVVPDNQNPQAVTQKNVDLAIIHPPHSGTAEHNPELLRLWSDYDLDKGLGGMAPYSVNGKFARDNPEATRDVVKALARAANWVNANVEAARKYTAERIGMKLEHVERYAYIENQVITEPPIQYYIDILEAEGKVAKGKVKVKDVYTNAFNPYVKA